MLEGFITDPFSQIAAILLLAIVFGGIGMLFRQPLIVTFIGVGILCGPDALGLVHESEILELLADMGIALLLFVVGLKLDISLVRTMGPVALATGLGQVLFTSIVGFGLALLLGFPPIQATYIAVALTFSSTIIIVKLLTDKGEIDSLHGRIAIGFLIVQDILVVLALIFLSSFSGTNGEDGSLLFTFIQVGVSGVFFLGVIFLCMRYVLPGLMHWVAKNQELLVLFSVTWAIGLAQAGYLLGFSHEVGAFLAGMSLAGTPFRENIGNRLTSLRDFLLLFFFIQLGSTLDLGLLGAQVEPALVFSAFVLIGNPIIVMIIMGYMGYRKRTGFLAGLTVAQISEFSLVLAALGVSVGHLDSEALGLITLVGLITIALSTYLILYSFPIYNRISRLLSIFERRTPYAEKEQERLVEEGNYDAILFGMGRFGNNMAERLVARGRRILVVDFDPEVVNRWRKAGHEAIYGDVDDPDLLDHVPISRTRWVVVGTPFRENSIHFIQSVRATGYEGRIAATVTQTGEGRQCLAAGADLIFRPFVDAAEQAVDALTSTSDLFDHKAPWPVRIREIRVPSGSVLSGHRLRDLSLRNETGATIVAVSRAGRSYFDLDAGFQIFPGDRLVLVGDGGSLDHAEDYITNTSAHPEQTEDPAGGLSMKPLPVDEKPEWIGQTIQDLDLRNKHAVTIISVKRGENYRNAPPPDLRLEKDDELFLLGLRENVQKLLQT